MVSREARSYVSKEIYVYHEIKREIQEIECDIIFSHSRVTDAVSMLVTHKTLNQMKNFVNAFESVFNRLQPDRKRAIELLYWSSRRVNCNAVGKILYVDGSTVGRWRQYFLNDVAKMMGLK